MMEPKTDRPHMPGYGIAGAGSGLLLPWTWAVERLVGAHNYFLATTRPDGRPHVMPLWGIWFDDRFWFSTGRDSRKARNLAANPRCVISPERADESVVLEGVAEEVTDFASIGSVFAAYKGKYDWDLDPALGPIYSFRPRVAFGFIETGGQFTSTATRWTFD